MNEISRKKTNFRYSQSVPLSEAGDIQQTRLLLNKSKWQKTMSDSDEPLLSTGTIEMLLLIGSSLTICFYSSKHAISFTAISFTAMLLLPALSL